MSLTEYCAELRGRFGQSFPCQVEYQGQSVFVVMECGRPCVDVSHPFIQRLIADDPLNLPSFLASIVEVATQMEREKLEALCRRPPSVSSDLQVAIPATPEHIYIIRAENGRFKIGRTGHLKSRLSALRTSSATSFDLFHSFLTNDSPKTEELLHEKFSSGRLHGEWFNLTQDDLTWLGRLNDFALDGDFPNGLTER